MMDVIREEDDLLETMASREDVHRVRQAVAECLTEQEREVVMLRYGLMGQAVSRQREVAQRLGISRSYVSRIEKRALEKLRRRLEES